MTAPISGGGLDTSTFFTAAAAIATFLGGAIAVLWRVIEAHQKLLSERAKNLEAKNEVMHADLQEVRHKVGTLEGRQQGVLDTCELTMKTVREAIKESTDAGNS